ncbi:MAG TPA: UDP-3-O-(3-hydroxymyristoyl)glucosamine N-acyltransferase [Candidatus Eisenbacteria bacterium]|nr:UDP-3-O-(3-hydroxymyristoyl)glucosamine N-acyltransferase [Candidatus Eisenbacteria bacterium]
MPATLKALAEFTASRLIGDGSIEIAKVASIANAQPGELVFVESARHMELAMNSRASAILVKESDAEITTTKPLLINSSPRLAFATAAKLLYPEKSHAPAIHPSAIIDPLAKLAPTASVEALAVIERNAVIGERCHIAPGCYIGEGVVIGDDSEIYPRVVIYPGTTIGRRVVVHAGAVLGSDGFGFVRDEKFGRYVKFPQVGRLVIGDYVEIGANCTIDRGALDETVIGSGTKFDNMVHIGHNSAVGANVVIAAQTGVSGSSKIGDDCVVGGQVGIGDHVTIEAGVILGSQGGVLPHKTIRGKGVVFWGTPAKPVREYLKELAMLSRLTRKAGE